MKIRRSGQVISLVAGLGLAGCATQGSVALPGHAIPVMESAQLIGPVDGEQSMPISISLKAQDPSGLEALLKDLYDVQSPLFHHYLTPEQYQARFGATDDQVQKVVSFLQTQGIQVSSISANNLLLGAHATAGQVQRAFGVSINNYLLADGRMVFANAGAPSVPADVASLIEAVHGLSNTFHYRPMFVRSPADPARHQSPRANGNCGTSNGGFGPAQLTGAYNLASLNLTGAGETVAVVEYDGFVTNDPACYFSGEGITEPTITVVGIDGGVTTPGSGETEVDLDIEVLGGIAPGATILVYEEAANDPDDPTGGMKLYQQIVSDDKVSEVSISWGGCENNEGSGALNAMHTVLQQGAMEGIGFFAAAGDSGAFDCSPEGQASTASLLSVDSPGSDPFVTSVGGTLLQLNGNAYGGEAVWGDANGSGDCGSTPDSSQASGGGGGGGYSMQWPKPSWQVGTGTVNSSCPNPNSTGGREVPDVSANADPQTGDAVFTNGQWTQVGGTSAAAPTWTGTITLINQSLKAQGKSNIGYANPTLYAIFANQPSAFNDVTQGDNYFFPATVGYDMGSGLGSPNGATLAQEFATVTPVPTPTPVPSGTATPTPKPSPTATSKPGNSEEKKLLQGCDVASNGFGGGVGGALMLVLLGAMTFRRRFGNT